MADEDFVDEYFTMETWLNDNIAVPAEVFRQFVKDLYQRNLLVKNQLRVGRRAVDLKRITCPLLNLMATKDDLVPCSQSEPLGDLVGSSDRKAIKVSRRAHRPGGGLEGPSRALAASLPVAGGKVVGRPDGESQHEDTKVTEKEGRVGEKRGE